MKISVRFLLVCAVCCFLDKVYSVPIQTDQDGDQTFFPTIYPGLSSLKSPIPSFPLKKGLKECGISKRTEVDKLSIVNGKDAIPGDWPWMVALLERPITNPVPVNGCGGSLISKQWVITAAHCITASSISDLYVRLGDLNLDRNVKDGAVPLDAEIDLIEPHPHYSSDVNADIALIRMKMPIHFTENIHPICLLSGPEYEGDEYYNGQETYITGWGDLKENGYIYPNHLQEASVTIVARNKCIESYKDLDEYSICAGGSGKDTCQGDSGGPLMFLNNTEKRFYLGGITSNGEGCARENIPGVYTKVAKFISWINFVTGETF